MTATKIPYPDNCPVCHGKTSLIPVYGGGPGRFVLCAVCNHGSMGEDRNSAIDNWNTGVRQFKEKYS